MTSETKKAIDALVEESVNNIKNAVERQVTILQAQGDLFEAIRRREIRSVVVNGETGMAIDVRASALSAMLGTEYKEISVRIKRIYEDLQDAVCREIRNVGSKDRVSPPSEDSE